MTSSVLSTTVRPVHNYVSQCHDGNRCPRSPIERQIHILSAMPPMRPRLHSACFIALSKPRLATANLPRLAFSWGGAQPDDHALNRTDELDVGSEAVRSGQRERAGESGPGSSAATEKDLGNRNKEAQKDHPEAPGPVIGMNDERGGVSKG